MFINMKEQGTDIYEELALLRALIGFLGEKSQFNWWDTNFLSNSGQQFLTIIFPRSAFSAGCNAVTEAAKRLHDDRIGRGGVYHLFRLPTSTEELIHRKLQLVNAEKAIAYLQSKDVAMECLKGSLTTTIEAPEGPVQIGAEKQLSKSSTLNSIAGHYYSAFSRQMMCFPYFLGD